MEKSNARHSGECRNPSWFRIDRWTPAFAGVTAGIISSCLRVFVVSILFLTTPAHAQQIFSVSSPTVLEGKSVPRGALSLECNGDNISPALEGFNQPEGTKSYAISVYDPDAEREGGYLHWVIFNIPASVRMLPADAGREDGSKLPEGANSVAGNAGKNGYTGPCPPEGSAATPHRYEFTVYAMPEERMFYPLSAVGKPTVRWLSEKALGSATLTVKYGR